MSTDPNAALMREAIKAITTYSTLRRTNGEEDPLARQVGFSINGLCSGIAAIRTYLLEEATGGPVVPVTSVEVLRELLDYGLEGQLPAIVEMMESN